MMAAYSSIDVAYCMALRERSNSGIPFTSKPFIIGSVVSVIISPLAFTPKSSWLVITPGSPSISRCCPLDGTMSNTTVQRSPSAYDDQFECAMTILPSLVAEPVAMKALHLPGATAMSGFGLCSFAFTIGR